MPNNLRAINPAGVQLNASFSLEATDNGFDVVLESRSGTNRSGAEPRNPDYEALFELVLRRATGLDASLIGAWVESRDTRALPAGDRLLRAPQFTYPVYLADVDDLRMLRTTVSSRQGGIGRRPGARGPGNRNKRVRLSFAVPEDLQEDDYLEAILVGDDRGARAEIVELLPEGDAPAWTQFDLTRVERLLARYASATPKVRQRAARAIERGPIGNMLKRVHGYRCQICQALGKSEASFLKKDGTAYVEAHHVVHVADGVPGSLRPENVIIVCASHHRELHYGATACALDEGDHFTVTVELGTAMIMKPDLRMLLAGAR